MNTIDSLPFRSILIYGMGLMGTSLAHAIRQVAPHTRICGIVRSRENANSLQKENLLNQIIINPHLENSATVPYNMYELIILAIPIQQILKLIPYLPPISSLISDLSSVQNNIQKAFQTRPELRFANSHPLCGSHKQGSQSAIPDLYMNKTCLISASKNQEKEIPLLHRFWHSLGMQTAVVEADRHDTILATLSHVPHLLSGLICLWANADKSVNDQRQKSQLTLAGGGFKSMARIAGSNPEMWADIIECNRENLINSLSYLEKDIKLLLKNLKKEKRPFWLKWFKKAALAKKQICSS